MDSADNSSVLACGFRKLHEAGAFSVGIFRCDGCPERTGCEAAAYPEIVLPQQGAYIRHDAAGSVYLDETAVGFFEAGREYVIRHLEPRPDVTTVISLKTWPDAETSQFDRGAIRASAQIHHLHQSLLRSLTSISCDPIEAEERAIWLILNCLSEARGQPELSAYVQHGEEFSEEILIAVVEYIRANFRRKLTLDELSAHSGYSSFHLCRAFRRRMRMTIFQYVEQLRLQTAHRALIETADPISFIALDHGFCSSSHLTSRFARWAGKPPSAIRRGSGPPSGRS